ISFSSGINQLLNIWNSRSAQIVVVWFLIICIKSVQLLVGLNGINHLKNNKVYPAGNKWDKKMNQLVERLGISQKITLLQSGIAQVPMVAGHFKPLILIPLGLINGLADNEVEAILCHELAHIKRRDYLVNLLQSFIEIVFFFNPAILWVSKLIREERENCCDDLAVSQLDDKRSYVKALITCQEFQLNAPRFVMAVTGKRNHLFNRISRMLFDTKTTLNKLEKTILTLALVSVVICSAAFKNVTDSNKSIKNASHDYSLQDTTKKKKALAEIDRKQANFDRLQAIKDAKQAQEDSKQAIIDSKQAVEDAKQAGDDATIAAEDAKQAKADALQAQIDSKIAHEEAKMHNNIKALEAAGVAKENARQAVSDAKQAKEDAKQNKNNNRNLNVSVHPVYTLPVNQKMLIAITPDVPVTQEISNPVAPPAPSVAPVKSFPKSGKDKSKTLTITGTQRTVQSVTSTDADVHDYKSIIKEMIQDGIINSADKLSYKLDKNSLIINGIKQAENYHLKYKNKYMQSENTALLYRYQMESNSNTNR
ncbi:MAG: hypothetical protein EOO43_10165, partial [Flavobacterium sp.]